MAKGDVDGLEDISTGGAIKQLGKLFVQNKIKVLKQGI